MHRRSSSRLPFLMLLFTLAGAAREVGAAAVYLPAIGGRGGSQFLTQCGPKQNLTGFEMYAGDDIDSLRPLCVTAYSSGSVTTPQLTSLSVALKHQNNAVPAFAGRPPSDTPFDRQFNELQGWHGGPGGHLVNVMCPHASPIVVAIYVAAEGANTITVNNIHLYCGLALPSQTLDPNPSAIFDAPENGTPIFKATQRCSDGQVAVGVHGRSGQWIDAIGLICDAPRVSPALSLGRVQSTAAPAPTRTLCEMAADARARNSPTAPALEARCEASKPPPKALGRVPSIAATGPPRTMCDMARDAAARNSPTAPALAGRCRASDLQSLPESAKRGESLANQDPLARVLRNQQPAGAGQRGFDIGMAVSEGQTDNGPGIQRIRALLSAAEQAGFDIAVNYSLERNRNGDLAARGAAVSMVDPAVAQAHNVEANVFYWLGFDIATGLFGDPASGGMGIVVAGPAELAVRDALSAPSQRGFNAAMALHLSRNNRNVPPAAQIEPALPAQAGPSAIVISQVYAGGGSAGALFASDFVELLNRSSMPVNLSGWSIQYAAANGVAWQVTPLTGAIGPGHYLLIGATAGLFNRGVALLIPDLQATLSMATNGGKIALVRSTAALNGPCPAVLEAVDFIGYGSANCSDGGMPAPELNPVTAAFRRGTGCVDTNINGMDFEAGAATPRNQATPRIACAAN